MEHTLAPVAAIFDLNTRLMLSCLDGVSEAHANARALPGTNSVAFVVAHLVDARYFAASLLGRTLHNPLQATLGAVQRIEDVTSLPPLDELRAMWVAVAKPLRECLDAASSDRLAGPSPHRFPVDDGSVLGGLAFLAQHESYHVGQLAFLRKALGYPAMSYSPRVDGKG